MQKEQFYNALEDVKSKLPPLRDDLIELTQEYPWFSTAHLLLAKTDHLTGHVAFDANLKRAAVYAGQREALFDLIHKEAFTDKVRAFEEEVERFSEEESQEKGEESFENARLDGSESTAPVESMQEPAAKVQTFDALEGKEEPEISEPLEVMENGLAPEEEILDKVEGPAESASSIETDQKAEEEGANELEDGAEIKHLDDFDDLQREILLEAISSSIEKEVQEEKEIEIDDRLEKPAAEQDENRVDFQEVPAGKPSSFTALLKQRSAEIKWEGGTEKAPEIPVVPDEKTSVTLSPDQLIDKFIAADPKITPRKSAEFSNENLAKKSLVEDEQFVTETIARIYAKQGATGKAIKAYKLLSLKYPEKSIYFAHQIKKLQDRRKSTK